MNAKGRAATTLFFRDDGNSTADEAKRCFEEAATSLPDLIDSYINLTNLYLIAKSRLSPHWIAETEKQIGIVERLDPKNIQNTYLRSKLAHSEEVGDHRQALALLDRVPDTAEKLFLVAEILSSAPYKDNGLDAAINAWEKAIAVLSEPTQEDVKHLKILIDLAHNIPAEQKLLKIATEGARRLVAGGKCDPDRARGREWLIDLEGISLAA